MFRDVRVKSVNVIRKFVRACGCGWCNSRCVDTCARRGRGRLAQAVSETDLSFTVGRTARASQGREGARLPLARELTLRNPLMNQEKSRSHSDAFHFVMRKKKGAETVGRAVGSSIQCYFKSSMPRDFLQLKVLDGVRFVRVLTVFREKRERNWVV